MLEWFRENGQIDFGNALVGLGTVAVAFVTLYVAVSANRQTRNRVLLDFTGLWIEEIRKAISSYIGAIESIPHPASNNERNALYIRIRELDVYLRLKFGITDPDAPALFAHMDHVLQSIRDNEQPPEAEVTQILLAIRKLLEDRWVALAG